MKIDFFIQECHHNGITLFIKENGKLFYKSHSGKIAKKIFNTLKFYNLDIINHLKKLKNAKMETDKADTLETHQETKSDKKGEIELNILYRDPKKVSLAFEQAKITLSEYKDYIETQKLLQESSTDKKLHEASVAKWNLYVRAYESLPEYRALLAVQKQLGMSHRL
jgi:hypothetical protein